MLSNSPLISIGITCFNSSKTLKRSIESALNQNWENKEIIIVDDFSSDESLQIIELFLEKYTFIKLIKHAQNKGYPAALNSIVKNAKGEYISIFDSDDSSELDRIRKQYLRLANFQKAFSTEKIICYSNRRVLKEKQSPHIAYAIGRKPIEPFGNEVADLIFGIKLPEKKLCWGLFGSCTMFIKKTNYYNLGGFDENLRRGSEIDFAIKAAFDNFFFISVNSPLVTQYKNEANYKSQKKVLHYSRMLLEKYKYYLKEKRSYFAAIFLNLMRNYSTRNNNLLSILFYFLAIIYLPNKRKIERLKNSNLYKKLFN